MDDVFTRWLVRNGYAVKRTEPLREFVEFDRASRAFVTSLIEPIVLLIKKMLRTR